MLTVISYILMLDSLLCPADSATLGLSRIDGARTVTVFTPSTCDTLPHYSNGAVLTAFKDKLYCMWQASSRDEDSPDTSVLYSISSDNGNSWSAPKTLVRATQSHFYTSGGWWVSGNTITAFINTWHHEQEPKGGTTQYITSTDGHSWSELQPVTMHDGTPLLALIEQDPHILQSGRIITAAHFMPGMNVYPIYTDDPSGHSGWHKALFTPHIRGSQTRELEPSTYLCKDGTVVMVFRDQSGTFRKMASVSHDNGATWSSPTITNIPDARTKQCAGNLPDGTAYLIGCPVSYKKRWPLTIMTSTDGRLFDKAWLLLDGDTDLQPRRYKGKAKTLGYSYPKAIVHDTFLFVAYSVNKEDIQVTRIPITLP